jgi:hypothetical protein
VTALQGGPFPPLCSAGDDLSFTKTLGLDLIILPGGEAILIELQSHFGRSGLIRLHPAASRQHREVGRRLRHRYGRAAAIYEKVRKICASKIETYRHLARYQPSSLVYQGWTPAVSRWVKGVKSDFILVKPPRGSCGRGIAVIPRSGFDRHSVLPPLTGPQLLQEYVSSRPLRSGKGGLHMGCIRHIVHLYRSGRSLGFVHLPPYWRVAPEPFSGQARREALTANISRGAFPLPATETDCRSVRLATERIALDLIRSVLPGAETVPGPSACVTRDGELRELRRGSEG